MQKGKQTVPNGSENALCVSAVVIAGVFWIALGVLSVVYRVVNGHWWGA